MEFDREYVRNLSLRLDVSILVRTVWAVLSCRGAY
jgi:lipopolysaccharide/colanic/teichoic acid biosynthesis glycosyltransferase